MKHKRSVWWAPLFFYLFIYSHPTPLIKLRHMDDLHNKHSAHGPIWQFGKKRTSKTQHQQRNLQTPNIRPSNACKADCLIVKNWVGEKIVVVFMLKRLLLEENFFKFTQIARLVNAETLIGSMLVRGFKVTNAVKTSIIKKKRGESTTNGYIYVFTIKMIITSHFKFY